jgi:ATP-dependent Lhr-like helicase
MAWFRGRHGEPTPAQAGAWPLVRAGHNVLIVSPTGTGKTLAAFLSVLDQLAQEHAAGMLRDELRCLYISPLRALGYDLAKNLEGPLREIYGETPPIRVGLRSGDTETTERDRQFTHPPHLLLTTPESLCLLLSQTRWLPKLATVRWVIVDELHALAVNKRGVHLALSLERLDDLISSGLPAIPPPRLQRIGLSATVHPLREAASFLVGAGRPCELVDVSTSKKIDLRVYTPLQREPYPAAGFSGVRLIRELSRLVTANRTTLVFTNTRSGAESASYWLREQLPGLANAIECHHASLDRDLRLDVEDRLKRGELRAVVCSTSLELGIDIGSIDLVVMLATPKGVARALQRTGRAGHDIRSVSRGLLMATNVGDLVECCATALLARAGHLDALRIATAPLDVLAQHLMGMGCVAVWNRAAAFSLVRRAWPYRELARKDFDDVLDFLAGGGASLRRQYTELFGKIHLDDQTFEARAGAPRRDFLQNIGTISGEGVVQVLLRNSRIGSVEEGFLRRMRVGDIFSLAGRPLRLERIGTMECWVTRAEGSVPTVPRWGANKFPLANRVAREIRSFRRELRERLEARESTSGLLHWIATRLDCGASNAAVIHRVHAAQIGISEIPTEDFLLVEELMEETRSEPPRPARRSRTTRPPEEPAASTPGQLAMPAIALASRTKPAVVEAPAPVVPTAVSRHYFFHSLIGRAANDALSRVVGLRLGRLRGGNAVATADDYGFVLTVAPEQRLTAADLPDLFHPDGFQADLDEVLGRSDLMKYHFRNAAQTGLMVCRNHFGEEKSVRKLQWSAEVIFNVLVQHEPDHVLLREARRDALHTFLDSPRALAWMEDFARRGRPVHFRTVPMVPPLSFGMYATKIKEALLVEDPQETLERLYHQWWAKLEAPQSAP